MWGCGRDSAVQPHSTGGVRGGEEGGTHTGTHTGTYTRMLHLPLSDLPLKIGFGKRGLLEKGSFQKSPFSRDSREFRDSRDFREPPDCGKQRRIRPFSRDSREFRDSRDSRDSSSEKTPFVMTPFSGFDKKCPVGDPQLKKRSCGPARRQPHGRDDAPASGYR